MKIVTFVHFTKKSIPCTNSTSKAVHYISFSSFSYYFFTLILFSYYGFCFPCWSRFLFPPFSFYSVFFSLVFFQRLKKMGFFISFLNRNTVTFFFLFNSVQFIYSFSLLVAFPAEVFWWNCSPSCLHLTVDFLSGLSRLQRGGVLLSDALVCLGGNFQCEFWIFFFTFLFIYLFI